MNIGTIIVLVVILSLCALAFKYMRNNNSHCAGCPYCKKVKGN